MEPDSIITVKLEKIIDVSHHPCTAIIITIILFINSFTVIH